MTGTHFEVIPDEVELVKSSSDSMRETVFFFSWYHYIAKMKKCIVFLLLAALITAMTGLTQAVENETPDEPVTPGPTPTSTEDTPGSDPEEPSGETIDPISDKGIQEGFDAFFAKLKTTITEAQDQLDILEGLPDTVKVDKAIEDATKLISDSKKKYAADNIAKSLRKITTITCIAKAESKAISSIAARRSTLKASVVKSQLPLVTDAKASVDALNYVASLQGDISKSVTAYLDANKSSRNLPKIIASVVKYWQTLANDLGPRVEAIKKQIASLNKSIGTALGSAQKSIGSDASSAVRSFASCR